MHESHKKYQSCDRTSERSKQGFLHRPAMATNDIAETATAPSQMAGRTSEANRASESARGPRLDPIAEAHIESLNYDGSGVAHIDGKVTFIEDALPGETVRLRYLTRRRNFDSAKLVEILSPSPERVAPACSHFGTCGGCSLQHLQPEAQLRAKQQVLAGQLQHIGKVNPESWLAPLTGPAWGYRRRARLGVRQVPGKGGVFVGFRERRKSFLANLNECPVLEPKLAALLPALRGLVAQLSCPQRIPQVEAAAGDDATALVIRHLLPLTDADHEQLRAFGEQHDLQIHLQGGGPDSITPLWPEKCATDGAVTA